MQHSFGPGPMTPAVRALLVATVAVFLAEFFAPGPLVGLFGLTPRLLFARATLWQLATYLFVHSPGSIWHILFNMLALWMFGVDLERRWGSRAFTTYYFACGIGAGLCTVLVSLLPIDAARASYDVPTIGASGAIYGLMLAWALLFPDRQIYFMGLVPMPPRLFVILMGAIAFMSALSATNNGVANVAHLGGLLVGWLYLRGPRNLRLELSYRLTRWKMDRMRRKFDVHRGGRDDWERHIH